ncbi:MAG: hypothetical protein HC880_03285 [Bacteroidia bacterium]|nr:hypothetical protein [Bacteroidia bacterium]
MNKDFDVNHIEAYLLDKLSREDKIAFQQLIEKDPILKHEIQFQHEIIEAICLQRKMELKDRLTKLDIQPASYSYWSRLALFGSAMVVLWVGTWLVWPETDSSTEPMPRISLVDPRGILQLSEPPILAMPKSINGAMKSAPRSIQLVQKPKVKGDYNSSSETLSLQSSARQLHQAEETTNADESPVDNKQIYATKLENIRSAKKPDLALPMSAKEEDAVKGLVDGSQEINLEDLAAKNKPSYQYINGDLFLYNHVSQGEVLDLEINGQEKSFSIL